MHDSSLHVVDNFLRKTDGIRTVLDVGSRDVNGTYRDIVPTGISYTGLDIEAGPGVDIVAPDLPWDLSDDAFDLVLCGQCLEHVRRPWELVREMGRVTKKWVLYIAPCEWEFHPVPIDCWRIYPDGMEVLLEESGCEVVECYKQTYTTAPVLRETVGVGRKVAA